MLIGYGATKATVLLTLEEVVNFHTVFEALLKLPNLYAPDDNGGDIKIAFETAYDNFPFDDLRRQVIILVTSSFDSDTFDDPIQTARQLKNDGITIITLAYDSSFDFPANLKSLASPGYNFISSDTSLITKIHKSLTEINCFCPPGTLQFTTIDKTGKEIKFSDCFEHFSAKIDPSLANNFCQKKNGISTYTTTPEKLNFIVDKIVPKSFQNVTEFLIGIYKKNDQWFWHNYNGNDFKIGLWPDVSKNVQGDYGYFGLSTDNSWKFSTIPAGKKYAKFILCQVQSCDTDHVCNMDLYTT
uniref:VWFA domain-containing protein n=1 Tax=Panagrolaimus sp. JU765 TaxID=591449 RepID=A0AC34QPB7_9BILA